MDETDGHEIECALRETHEEIGLDSAAINVWGTGSQITPTFGTAIVPVIAEIRNFSPAMLKLNHDEVAEIHNIPLERLMESRLIRHTQFRTSSGQGYVLPVFLGGKMKFWGATALVTHLLLSSLLPKEVYATRLPVVMSYKP
jgi:nudix motif 8